MNAVRRRTALAINERVRYIDRARGEMFSGTGEQRLRWAFAALIAGIADTPTPTGTRDKADPTYERKVAAH